MFIVIEIKTFFNTTVYDLFISQPSSCSRKQTATLSKGGFDA